MTRDARPSGEGARGRGSSPMTDPASLLLPLANRLPPLAAHLPTATLPTATRCANCGESLSPGTRHTRTPDGRSWCSAYHGCS